MKNRTDAWKLDAFVDGELDLAGQLEMEERLRDDATLRGEVDELRSLREIVRERADRHAAPESLRARMAGALDPGAPAPAPAPARALSSAPGAALRRWFAWRPLAASLSFAAVLAVALNLAWLQSGTQERLAEDVVASHVRATLGQHLTDVASSDHHTVKPFLSSRLGFSPPVPELQLPGSTFLGGRVDYLDGRPVAALVYRQGQHIVDSFVWPGSATDSPPVYATQRGYRTAHWSRGGMNHWLVSDVNREEFEAIVAALRNADASP